MVTSKSLILVWDKVMASIKILQTKIIENKIQFKVQKLDYPCRNLVIRIGNRNERSRNGIIRT